MTDQDRIKELERENEALKARLSANDTQPDSSASSVTPSVPLWKKIVGGVLLLLLCVGVYYCYKGHTIQVLTYLDMFIFGLGVVLVFIFLFSKETFLWLIGKKREYHNILKAGQSLTTGAVGTALKYAPIDLNDQEKEKIKRDVPALVEMGLMTGINNYIIRFFIATFTACFALLGTIVLMNQNVKITTQNNLVAKQTKRLDQQTYLQEAERRSSLVFLFSNIMDAVDEELKTDIGEKGVRDLSPQLIGRITGLSTRLKPYRYLDGDSLTTIPLSPERAQLLVSLLGSQLDTITLTKIYDKANFSCADLKDASLGGADLSGANLSGADLSDANLWDADLSDADLSGADLNDADLKGAELGGVEFFLANLSLADLRGANLRDAELFAVNLSYANLSGVNLSGMDLSEMILFGADLRDADLRDADLSGAFLIDADLSYADLSGTNLTFTMFRYIDLVNSGFNYEDLRYTHLSGTDLSNAKLSGTKLNDADLSGTKVNNDFLRETQLSTYQIDSTFEGDEWIYRLKQKK